VAGVTSSTPSSTPSSAPASDDVTITIGPRRFGGTRDILTATAFAAGLLGTLVVAVVAGLPGVIGSVYVLTAFAAWVQGFRRSWRISTDRIEARRWFRWHRLERADISAIEAARDEMGIRAVALASNGTPLEIDVDDVRLEPLLAEALARFVHDCHDDGVAVDPLVPSLVRR
jgi:hypothetical protein